jgi:hypothetical protein
VNGVYVFAQRRCECVEHRLGWAVHPEERAVYREEQPVHLHALVPSPAEWDGTPAALPRRGQHQEEHRAKRVMTV